MPAFSARHYVPFLKGKKGEYDALAEIDAGTKDGLTPLVEIAPADRDLETGEPLKTVTQKLDGEARRITDAWGTNHELFLDLAALDPDDRLDSGAHPVTGLFAGARSEGLLAIPVTGLDRDGDFNDAVRDVAATDRRGAAIRLHPDDIASPASLASALDQLARHLVLAPRELDLLVDFGEVTSGGITAAEGAAKTLLPQLPRLEEWRTLTFCSGAFPQSVAGVAVDTEGRIQRLDWILWKNLEAATPSLPRKPSFGDYAINHPDFPDFDPRFMTMTAAIRYTTDDDWLIVRGHKIRKGDLQFQTLAGRLTARNEWQGGGHCWGDRYVDDAATRGGGPGGTTTWRAVGTNHHLTVVVAQIASLP
jgi:hypothetical protein